MKAAAGSLNERLSVRPSEPATCQGRCGVLQKSGQMAGAVDQGPRVSRKTLFGWSPGWQTSVCEGMPADTAVTAVA